MQDLNDLVAADSGWALLEEATAISNNGWITGFGWTTAGDYHAFLLTPTPEPASLSLLLVGYLVAMPRRR